MRPVRKVSDFCFSEKLVDFNEARLYEATLNLHTHALIVPLSIVSVDGKQYLNEVAFSALVGFSLYKVYWKNIRPSTS